jgi:50S ribosomal protein L16 3-hydroxylase
MVLRDFDSDGFLRNYWQKRPVLIRNPWAEWRNPLEPDELAGLACEAAVESRLVFRAGGKARGALRCQDGPFDAASFARLSKQYWTLLVQAVDHHVPGVAALIEPFRFVPNWRIDDVMVSYAVNGGGVGPHFDQYDVFLIQGLGRRRWQVGGLCDATTELAPHADLRLLAEFSVMEEWILEPGDMLYVPPGIAHSGVAVGDDCMTYSIGFRAPARSDLLSHWCDHLLAAAPEDDRYGDPELCPQLNPGEITPEAIAGLHALVTEKMSDRAGFARWFGQFSSMPKYPDLDWRPAMPLDRASLQQHLADGVQVFRNPASRFSFIRQGRDSLTLFVDGECRDCGGEAAEFAEQICAQSCVDFAAKRPKSDTALDLILWLFNRGSVSFEMEGFPEA